MNKRATFYDARVTAVKKYFDNAIPVGHTKGDAPEGVTSGVDVPPPLSSEEIEGTAAPEVPVSY